MGEDGEVQTATTAGPSLVKLLASTNTKTRNRTLRTILNTWLPAQTQIPEDELKKLWKGLFYCFWHADKLPAQTHLVHRLSALITTLPLPLSVDYFRIFMLTMRREWNGIDGLRLDKFYLLIRRFIHGFFELLGKSSWDLEEVKRMMGVLVEGTFLAGDNGHGVGYHVAAVFLEEFRPFLPLRKAVVEAILEPFVSIMGRVGDKVLVGKIKSNVFDVLLQMGRKLLEVRKTGGEVEEKGEDGVAVLGSIALVLGFSSRFYELGSSVECCQGNRKVLLGLHEEFFKLEKDMTASGISVDISVPDDDDEEVPELVPIVNGMEVDASDVSASKQPNRLGKIEKKKKKDKSKKKKKKLGNPVSENCDGNENGVKHENSGEELNGDENLVLFNESTIANLQKQFEKVASEVGLGEDVASACEVPEVTGNGIVTKKRKRAKSADSKKSKNSDLADQEDAEGGATTKSAKKVRFSMKNNLVWKPHNPLPPEELRIPPSVTPRGSALKKGLSPGPIIQVPSANKKVKQRTKSMKKGLKAKQIGPAKRLKKLKSISS